jgi:hypothetical protein
MRRNTAERPAEALDPAGISIPRNPGVTLLWITRSYQVLRTSNGVLFRLAEPHELVAYAEGKITTRDALDASVASGLPILASMAAEQGEDAMQALLKQCDVAEKLFDRMLPARAAVA